MKNFIKSVISWTIIFVISIQNISDLVNASDFEDTSIEEAVTTNANINSNIEITAKSGVSIEMSTGKILYEHNAYEELPLASITKVMTMLLVAEALEGGDIFLEDMATTSSHAAGMGGSQIWLKENEQMSVADLLKACAVASANDAAMVLAELVGGSEENFVSMMNSRAGQLGMENTHFINPTGLDAEGHYSSAYDIALMSCELMKHEYITTLTSIWMDSLRDGATELVNTNKLVRFYDGCTGLKTGTTDDAGSCLSATATRDGMSIVSVVLGADNSTDRFNDAKKLLDMSFTNFSVYTLSPENTNMPYIKVKGGLLDEVDVQVDKYVSLVVDKADVSSIKSYISIEEEFVAPIQQGAKLGEILIMQGEEEIAKLNLIATHSVEKKTFLDYFSEIFKLLVTI